MWSGAEDRHVSLRELFGIDHPIIQAPMAGSQGSALAIAVSNAGGLGSLPAALLDAAGLRQELERVRAASALGEPFTAWGG